MKLESATFVFDAWRVIWAEGHRTVTVYKNDVWAFERTFLNDKRQWKPCETHARDLIRLAQLPEPTPPVDRRRKGMK